MSHRRLYHHYESIRSSLWDVNASLRPFFNDPDEFRELQARTGLVVSGSHALQFIGRFSYGDTDLDLCVEQMHAEVVLEWLTSQDYVARRLPEKKNTVVNDTNPFALQSGGTEEAYNMGYGLIVYRADRASDVKRIDLIVSPGCALACVLNFHSTAVMNFIAADCAVSLFPHATFVQGISLVMRNPEPSRAGMAIDKYKKRGYQPVFDPGSSFAFTLGYRWLRDRVPDADMEWIRGTLLDTEIRARSCWVVPLAMHIDPERFTRRWPVGVPRWTSLRNDSRRVGSDFWNRHGWKIVQRRDGCEMDTSDISYDGVVQYCVPHEFRAFLANKIVDLFGTLSPDRKFCYDRWQIEFMETST